ncbi:MAG: hypothetical protein A2W80_08905 [Candidatus Riflebacteria bacterium GWC2_50_8]|nr:MAG: hypothetical protein A2W80_08905 [Candidatus Riflebacteria bacterium GWC2_50_8]
MEKSLKICTAEQNLPHASIFCFLAIKRSFKWHAFATFKIPLSSAYSDIFSISEVIHFIASIQLGMLAFQYPMKDTKFIRHAFMEKQRRFKVYRSYKRHGRPHFI